MKRRIHDVRALRALRNEVIGGAPRFWRAQFMACMRLWTLILRKML